MSTLTKILIVLLTLSSIFLCGIVVAYVAKADNYKQLYENERSAKDAATARKNSANKLLEEKRTTFEQQEDGLNKQIASLRSEIDNLKNNLKNVSREKVTLDQKVQSWVSITEDLTKTTDDQRQLLEKTLTELEEIKAQQIKERDQLNDVTNRLIEKMAVIETLQADKKRLEEEKSELQSQLDRLLRPVGKEVPGLTPVTPIKGVARPVTPVTRKIELKGLITALDLKNSVAEISIGTAHGVKEGMKFYVIRGDKFICEILIHYVDAERAVGDLKRLQDQPKVGDEASTSL